VTCYKACEGQREHPTKHIRGLGLIKPFLPSAQASIEIIHTKIDVGLLVDEISNLNEIEPLPKGKQGNPHSLLLQNFYFHNS
jgi:hypothetical protein